MVKIQSEKSVPQSTSLKAPCSCDISIFAMSYSYPLLPVTLLLCYLVIQSEGVRVGHRMTLADLLYHRLSRNMRVQRWVGYMLNYKATNNILKFSGCQVCIRLSYQYKIKNKQSFKKKKPILAKYKTYKNLLTKYN